MGTKMYYNQFTTSDINRNFWIKVYGYIDGVRINTLLGVSGAIYLLGDLFYRLVARAMKHLGETGKTICRLRRGIRVTFYEK